jgi:hypothetical protein
VIKPLHSGSQAQEGSQAKVASQAHEPHSGSQAQAAAPSLSQPKVVSQLQGPVLQLGSQLQFASQACEVLQVQPVLQFGSQAQLDSQPIDTSQEHWFTQARSQAQPWSHDPAVTSHEHSGRHIAFGRQSVLPPPSNS